MPVCRTAYAWLVAAFSTVLLTACDSGTGPTPAGPLEAVQVASGNNQIAVVATKLPGALAVRSVDAAGVPIAGQQITFLVTAGGGTVTDASAVTNGAGVAETRWTLGTSAAEQQVQASATDRSSGRFIAATLFSAIGTPALPSRITVSVGGDQTVAAGAPVDIAPRVRVTDVYGNAVPNAIVTFAVVAGGGSITGERVMTDEAGEAAVGSWIVGSLAGVSNTLTATVGTVSTTVSATTLSPVRVAISAPRALALVAGRFTVAATATTLAAAGPITSVVATVEGRATTLIADAGGTWSAPIEMGTALVGPKLISVTAVDRAGNSATTTLPVSYGVAASFVQLRSDAGDYIGGGRSYDYDASNSVINVSASAGRVSVSVDGDANWNATFAAPIGVGELQPATFSGLRRYPFHDVARGGLNWSGDGRGCNTLTGSFTIDSVTYVAGVLKTLDLRFEQYCEGGVPALRGTVHWRADDLAPSVGPVSPVPADLWQPPAALLPPTGNFVLLDSDAGDYIGGGQLYLYRQAVSPINVGANGGRLSVSVGGWYGEFQAMAGLSRLQPGYYGNLTRYPFHNATRGGLSWSGNGRGCNTLTGWFAIDRVTYVGSTVTAVDLRFEQHCEGGGPALRGAIRWVR